MSTQYEKHKYYADNELVFGALVMSVITSFPPRITIKNRQGLLPVNWQQRFYVKIAATS